MAHEIDSQDFIDALDRIARTEDGVILYRFLQKTLCGVTYDTRVLPTNEGKRMFASQLMGLMAKGISTHDRRDAVVTFSLGSGRANNARPAGGRRVTADSFVPGFSDPRDLEPSGQS